jgi:putative transposase
MPRRARIMLPGVAVHVIQRGNNRAACFVSQEDRAFYLFHLSRMLPRAGCLLHAYCLMTNHVHLLLTTQEGTGCALLMNLACYRYIDLNPVRAGLATRADEYSWSSFRFNATGETSGLLSPHNEYLRLGGTPAERQAMYRDLIAEVQGPDRLQEIRNATNGGYVLGSAAFRRAMARALGRRVDRGSAGRPARQPAANEQSDLLAPGINEVRP